MHAVPSSLKGKYVIRYTVTSPRTTLNDIARDWEIIQQFSTEVLAGDMEVVSTSTTRTRMPLKGLFIFDCISQFLNNWLLDSVSKIITNFFVQKSRKKIHILDQVSYWQTLDPTVICLQKLSMEVLLHFLTTMMSRWISQRNFNN